MTLSIDYFFFGYRHLISEHLWIKIVHRKSLGHYLLNRIQFYLFTGVRFYLPVSLAFTISSSWIYRFGIDNQVRFAWSMATNIIMIFFFCVISWKQNETKSTWRIQGKYRYIFEDSVRKHAWSLWVIVDDLHVLCEFFILLSFRLPIPWIATYF